MMNINICKWVENGKTDNINISNQLGDKNKDRKKKTKQVLINQFKP